MKKDITFDELVELATQRIHSGLLIGGGKEMKSQIHMWMAKAIDWYKENNKSK